MLLQKYVYPIVSYLVTKFECIFRYLVKARIMINLGNYLNILMQACNKAERTKQMEPILTAKVKFFSKVKILKNAFDKK